MAIINGDNASNDLNGTNLADQIYSLGGNDILIGLGGDDTLEGGAGADELFGSNGLDLASYKASPAGVFIVLKDFYANGGHATGDHLYSIGGVVGSSYSDQLYGDDERNILRGEGSNDLLAGYDGNDLLAGGGGADYLVGGAGADELRGGDGSDSAWYISSPQAVQVDLAAGTGLGNEAEGDRLFSVENLLGSSYGDQLAGTDGANALEGSGGGDVLIGRGGPDRFVYGSRYDSNPKAPDLIRDFSHSQGDRIDLRSVDANEQVDGNQAFQFVGQAQTTSAGQLRFFQRDGDTYVEADVSDAINGAELQFVLDPLVSLQATDFVL